MDDKIKVSFNVYGTDDIPTTDAADRIAVALEKIAAKP